MAAGDDVMEKKLLLRDLKNSYNAEEASASSASTVDELRQEISVSSLMFHIDYNFHCP